MMSLPTNRIGPLEKLASDRARVMASLVIAMQAAQNWHDIMRVADCIVDVEVCHYGPMRRELERLCSDGPMSAQAPETQAESPT